MDFVITIVSDPAKEILPKTLIHSMAALLAAHDIHIENAEWMEQGVAGDIIVSHEDQSELDQFVQNLLRGQTFDAIVQPLAHRKKKLFVADMESTIITCECLDELADYAGLRNEIATITARAMNGEIDFAAALTQRVALLKGLPESTLQKVYDKKVKIMPGAKELMAAMRKQGAYTLLVSGGFTFYTLRIATVLGFDEARANKLEIVDGKLTGRVIPPILGKEGKLAALQETCEKLGIGPEDVLAIGDGANDLPMLMAAGLGVAYHAKPVVRAQARARIEHCDLKALVWAVGG